MTLNASGILLFFGAVDSLLAMLTTANNQPANSCNRLSLCLVLTSYIAHFRSSPCFFPANHFVQNSVVRRKELSEFVLLLLWQLWVVPPLLGAHALQAAAGVAAAVEVALA